jgi:peptidyl-prolyl cis-trans isomerase SurA
VARLRELEDEMVANLIKARAAELGRDTLVNTIRNEFSRKVAIDKVLVAKGSNPMVDNIVFGGPVVTPKNANLEVYFMIDPRVITEPEEVGDVRGLVTSDYQNQFQEEWEKELRNRYPVKVYDKVLRKVK